MAEPALEARGLSFRYLEQNRKNVLEDVCIRFPAGKITILMGSSGCGKSTLAALLAGLYPENGGIVTGGERRLFGRPMEDYTIPQRAQAVSMMFQNADLQFCMETLRQELTFCLENISCPPEEMAARATRAAAELGMEDLLDRPFTTLSGGEKQKAALCCIFLLGAKAILLDEPFANIDPFWAARIAQMLKALNRQYGTAIIVIDHMLDHWLDAFDEIQILRGDGQVCSGITRENLVGYQSLFQEEGLRWPYGAPPARSPGAGEKPPAIILEGLTLSAGKGRRQREGHPLLLQGAKALFRKGEMTALMGPSGCGKTTLFRALLGQQAYGGSIRIGGRECKKIPQKELFREIGIVFQNPSNQFITQNVLQEAACGLQGRMVKKEALAGTELEKQAIALLEEFNLHRFRKYSPYMLSQGQQRRLAVLSILAGKQGILLLDEPTYGQDDAMTREIMGLLRRKVEEEGLTVLFSTHDARLAAEWADTCYVFSGKELCREDHGIHQPGV